MGVVEIFPYASGLPRNVVQCLDDYDIPLFLNHTVTNIEGKERLEQVTIAQVGENMVPIAGTEKQITCDTLLLSLGLIPENELVKNVGIEIDPITGGPIVNQSLETTLDGVFACGNCLQVYDTVDMLSIDAKRAGKYATNRTSPGKNIVRIIPGKKVRYVVPQRINEVGKVSFTLRVEKPCGPANILVMTNGKELLKKKVRWANPANMIRIDVNVSEEVIKSGKTVEVSLDV